MRSKFDALFNYKNQLFKEENFDLKVVIDKIVRINGLSASSVESCYYTISPIERSPPYYIKSLNVWPIRLKPLDDRIGPQHLPI